MDFQSNVFTLNTVDGVSFLTYDRLSQIPFIRHAFSTKIGKGSRTRHPMDMSFDRDDREAVTENYKLLCNAAGLDYSSLVASAQDHHTFVRVCTSAEKGIGIYREKDMQSVDGLVTIEPGLTLCTYYADCTPLFFVDTKQKAIGLAHAGWRGTVGRIGEKVVNKMSELYGTNPADIVAAIGPAISVCCYEVDKPCADNFYALGDLDSSRFVFPKENGKYMIDLLETNRQILVAAGIRNENITVSDVCTNCNSELLWSHRATKGKRGTMSAFMCIV